MISVAMATYNGEKFINEQLDSIYNQTLRPEEVIICDDNSTDNTVDCIKNFIKKYQLEETWKVYINEHNLGYIDNFIKAVSLTKGDLIFLSDQDDYFYKDKFKRMSDVMYNLSDCVLLNANFEIINEESKKKKDIRNNSRFRKKACRKLSFEEWLYESSFPGFSMCMKNIIRDRLDDIVKDGLYGHDQLFGLMAIDADGNYEMSEVLSGYRQYEDNTTGGTSITEDYRLASRIKQKRRELEDYSKLENLINNNRFKNINFDYLYKRKKDLKLRIECMEKKNIMGLIKLFVTCKTFPQRTIAGDIVYIIRGKV